MLLRNDSQGGIYPLSGEIQLYNFYRKERKITEELRDLFWDSMDRMDDGVTKAVRRTEKD